jgi:hypothetical protein
MIHILDSSFGQIKGIDVVEIIQYDDEEDIVCKHRYNVINHIPKIKGK